MNGSGFQPRLRTNIAALSLIQVGNYVIPLITLPYLARALGAEAFGKVAFAQILMTYFVLLVDYGFSWSATRKVAAQRTDQEAVSRIFVATWVAQWLLVVVAGIAATFIVLLTDRLRPDALLYAAAFSHVLGAVLFPVWLLQGLEQLQVVAALQLITRALAVLPIFIFIKQPGDAAWVLLIQGGGAVLSGGLALLWIHRRSIIVLSVPEWREIMVALREGGVLFSSRVSISLYTALVPLVLGWLAGPIELAYFNLSDKLRGVAQSLLTPLTQALFPRVSHLVATDGRAAYQLVKRAAIGILIMSGTISVSLWMLSDWLVLLLGGEGFLPSADILRWLAPLPLVIGLSNLFGVQIMLPHRLNRVFNGVLMSAGVISLFAVGPLTSRFHAIGAAQTLLMVEVWVATCMAVLLWKRGYFSSSRWGKM